MELNQSLPKVAGEHIENEASLPNVSSFERGLSIGVGALFIYSGVNNFRKAPVKSLVRAVLGSGLILRGVSGTCPLYSALHVDGTKSSTVHIQTGFTVNKPRTEVYQAWRNLGTLPKFMKHLSEVKEINGTKSHWELRIPKGIPLTVQWEAEIIKDEPGALLSWKSLPGAPIDNAGKVEFRDALGHKGTEIRVTIVYRPPAGNIGHGVAKLLNPLFRKMVREDILGFKEYIEMRSPIEPSGGFR